MNAKSYIVAIGVFGFLLIATIVGAIALDSQYQRSAGAQTISGERVEIDTAEPTPVEAANYTNNFEPTVTVRVDGTNLTSGDDYTWYPADGEISWNASSSQVSDGQLAAVTYSYYGHPLSVEKTRDIRTTIMTMLPYLGLTVAGVGLLGLFAGLYRSGTNSSPSRRRR